ncbi:MAG: hypothetical protein AAFX58_05345 [Pseudomonadota bacterium]
MAADTATIWQRLRDRWRHRVLLQEILNRLSRIGIGLHPYTVFEEAVATADTAPSATDLACRRLAAGDLPAASAIAGRPVPVQRLQARLDEGQIGIGAFEGDTCVSYTWADLGQFHGLGAAVSQRQLLPHEAFLYDAYTAPAMRGRAIVPVVRAALYYELAAVGRTRLLSVSQYFNRPARRFKLKLGAREIETRLYLHIGSFVQRDWRLSRGAADVTA